MRVVGRGGGCNEPLLREASRYAGEPAEGVLGNCGKGSRELGVWGTTGMIGGGVACVVWRVQ
nr:hypothetical protein [Chlamydia abortus]